MHREIEIAPIDKLIEDMASPDNICDPHVIALAAVVRDFMKKVEMQHKAHQAVMAQMFGRIKELER